MKKRIRLLPVLLLVLLVASPALASVIDNALYSGNIRVTNSANTTYSNVSANFTLDSDSFISNGFAGANMTDIAIQLNGTDTAFMPGYSGNPWILFVEQIGGNQNIDYDLYTGNVTGGKIRYFPAAGGFTVDDAANLELGDSFETLQKGWIDTSAGSDKNLISKPSAFKLYISAAGNITAEITGGASVTASGVSSGEHIVKVTSDGIDLKIFIDDVEKDSTAMTANVTDNGNNWVFLENYAMIYMEYTKVWSSE